MGQQNARFTIGDLVQRVDRANNFLMLENLTLDPASVAVFVEFLQRSADVSNAIFQENPETPSENEVPALSRLVLDNVQLAQPQQGWGDICVALARFRWWESLQFRRIPYFNQRDSWHQLGGMLQAVRIGDLVLESCDLGDEAIGVLSPGLARTEAGLHLRNNCIGRAGLIPLCADLARIPPPALAAPPAPDAPRQPWHVPYALQTLDLDSQVPPLDEGALVPLAHLVLHTQTLRNLGVKCNSFQWVGCDEEEKYVWPPGVQPRPGPIDLNYMEAWFNAWLGDRLPAFHYDLSQVQRLVMAQDAPIFQHQAEYLQLPPALQFGLALGYRGLVNFNCLPHQFESDFGRLLYTVSITRAPLTYMAEVNLCSPSLVPLRQNEASDLTVEGVLYLLQSSVAQGLHLNLQGTCSEKNWRRIFEALRGRGNGNGCCLMCDPLTDELRREYLDVAEAVYPCTYAWYGMRNRWFPRQPPPQ